MPCVLRVPRHGLSGYIYSNEQHKKPHIHIYLNKEVLFVFELEPPFECLETLGPKYGTQEKYMRRVLEDYYEELLKFWKACMQGKNPKEKIIVPVNFR